ncbi:MAG: type II toxin-antitoxin system RelE family toxin [Candidatus Saccharimonadales bacterium]
MPDLYKVYILPIVIRKDLNKIPKADNQRIMAKIKSLANNPRPTWSKKLSARDEYRGRQGVYRILYIIDDEVKIVQVTKVRHRKVIYR